jgi:hypothetical protein
MVHHDPSRCPFCGQGLPPAVECVKLSTVPLWAVPFVAMVPVMLLILGGMLIAIFLER